MSAVSAYRAESGLVCACIPTVAVIADMVPESVLEAKLRALGVGEPEWLDADAYRAAHRSAIVGSIEAISEQVDAIEDVNVRADLAGKIAEARLYAERLGEQQAELIRLQTEANQQKERALQVAEQQEQRIAETRAAQAKADDTSRWTDIQVVQGPDGAVEMLKHFVEFVAFVGPKREPEFRRYAVKLGRWENVELVPPDVRERINKPFARSKVTIPER